MAAMSAEELARYVRENGAEQTYRDVRIAPVWEGTTQIQALDLLGRKIMLQKLAPINSHCGALRRDFRDGVVRTVGIFEDTYRLAPNEARTD